MPKRVSAKKPKKNKKSGYNRDLIDQAIDVGYIACHLGEITERVGHFKNGKINRELMNRVVRGYKLVGLVRKAKNELDGRGERSYKNGK